MPILARTPQRAPEVRPASQERLQMVQQQQQQLQHQSQDQPGGQHQHQHQHQLNQMHQPQQPRPVVVCGPSGSGKSTLLRRLMGKHRDAFAFTVSHTTRQPRLGELEGRDYHFVSRGQMLKMVERGEFVEHTSFAGNLYGTSKQAVRAALARPARHLLLEVDLDGVLALSSIKELRPVLVFVRPASREQLRERLLQRNSETAAGLERRLERADRELRFADSGRLQFDLVLVNDDLEQAYARLERFLALG